MGSGSETPDISEGPKIGAYYEVESDENNNKKYAEDVAKMVFSFVSGAGGLVQGMDDEDEVKLLRIRTRKSEIVIVPGQSLYLTSTSILRAWDTLERYYKLLLLVIASVC